MGAHRILESLLFANSRNCLLMIYDLDKAFTE